MGAYIPASVCGDYYIPAHIDLRTLKKCVCIRQYGVYTTLSFLLIYTIFDTNMLYSHALFAGKYTNLLILIPLTIK